MKGLVLSGGKGTRLRPITYTNAKQLVPIANKPVLFRVIESIVEAGITEIGVVVGDTAKEIKAAVGDGERFRANISYIQQDAPLGLAHAVKISQSFLGEDRFVMFLGDNVIQGGISELMHDFACCDFNSRIVLKKVSNPQQFGVAELGEDKRIIRLVEKPENPLSDLALVGIYMFDHHVFEAVNAIIPSRRGELEITDAIQWLIEHDYKVAPHVHEGWWIDTGKMEDMLEANCRVLDELEYRAPMKVPPDSEVDGKVVIEPGVEISSSTIRGPAIIGEGTRIIEAYIGPYTSIYHHCLIQNAEIERSIVLENSCLRDVDQRIEDSLIGRSVEVIGSSRRPRTHKLTLSDHSRVSIVSNGK
jgi:glucose-1-phosphate thymidylyltransferase